MTIVLFILKIIGVVLLAVLGILLLVLLALLFVPFRYEIRVESGGEEMLDGGQSSRQSTNHYQQANRNSVIERQIAENESVDSKKKELHVTALARLHWLLHFFGAEVNFHDGQLDANLRILFWKKKLLNNEEAKEDEADFKKDAKATTKDVAEEAVRPPENIEGNSQKMKPLDGADEASQQTEPSNDTKSESQQKKGMKDRDASDTKPLNSSNSTVSAEKRKNPKTDDSKKNSSINKEENKKESNKEERSKVESGKKEKDKEENNKEEQSDSIITRMKKLWNNFSNFRKKITRMVEDERNHRAVSHLKAELIRILQAIRPRKLSIDMEFSLGSPDLTGEVLGVCALFPISYQSGNRLIPDFEADEAYAKGYMNAKGRIYLYQILVAVLRVLFDKDCKRMYRMFRKYFG